MLVFSIVTFLRFLFPETPQPSTFNLAVEFEGNGLTTGVILVALYQNEKEYNSQSYYKKDMVILSDDTKPISQFNLEKGNYALGVFHDRNNNGKLDKNWFGMPIETYGFSNDARGSFGPPKYEEALISLKADQKIKITLK